MSTSAEDLASAVRSLSVCSDIPADDWIDSALDGRLPRKRPKPPVEDWQVLEDDFLKPSHIFPTEWLNKLQRYAYPPLYLPPPLDSYTLCNGSLWGGCGEVDGKSQQTIHQ